MFNKENYINIKNKIPKHVKILAATKGKSINDIKEAVISGIKFLGENYVNEAFEKYSLIKDFLKENNVELHLIGHLQTNKTKKAVQIFNCIQSIDSVKIANEIEKECKKLGKKIDVMIEINFGEIQKSGIMYEEAEFLAEHIQNLKFLNLKGIMCIPPIGKEEECFKKMRILKDKLKLEEISMGMSNDFIIAIENGSTMIRLGKALFDEREMK